MRLGFDMHFLKCPGHAINDINVLQQSPLMTRLALRKGPLVEFEANGHKYNYGYFLANSIYPSRLFNHEIRNKPNFIMHKR
jgi:hypothetical protein